MKVYFSFKKVKNRLYPYIKIRAYNIEASYRHRRQGEVCKTGSSAIDYLLNDLIKSDKSTNSLIAKLNLSSKLNFLTYSEIEDSPSLTYEPTE